MKKILKKYFPKLFDFVKNIYCKIQDKYIELGKTKRFVKYWKNRKDLTFFDHENHPSKKFLIDHLEVYKNNSFFEFGCNSGINLYLIAKKTKKKDLVISGVDICSEAIKDGKIKLKENNVTNVHLFEGGIEAFKAIPDDSYDITFTCATLMYIGPDKIQEVMNQFYRITRKKIVLLEFHSPEFSAKGNIREGLYVRDYAKLIKNFKVEIKKIPKKIWGGPKWGDYGHIIII